MRIKILYTVHCNSVSHLSEILKQAIENEQQLLQEIKLPCQDLQIDMVSILYIICNTAAVHFCIQSVLVMDLPSPPRPETPNEPSSYDQFTIVQLVTLHQQLRSIAPTGMVMYKTLVDTIHSLSHTSVSFVLSIVSLCTFIMLFQYGSDNLPDSWTDLTLKQVNVSSA